ncbi:hypothetical protein [Fictibacillus phosphorivorans]|uniref:hypothetical protein n=1 Tax=Fictibacillus phosphorivorans TaxID=1221500 RepID=UPI0011A817A0|nr:hypothetical protein [Fictibacillus phosphorivorans]
MKTEKLKPGQTIKNYKVLCEFLEVPVKSSSKSKMYQFKELERFCKFRKSGHNILIDEVYETPIEKIENRGKSAGSRRSIYGNAIQLLIADLLAQSGGHISISRSRLLNRIGMINNNYGGCGELVPKLSKYTRINEKVIYDFYNTSNSNFKSTIESALNNLMDKRIIMFNTVIKIREKGEFTTRIASENELSVIMDCEKEVLEEMKYQKMSLVRISRDWKKFKGKVKKYLNEYSHIEYYYTAYDITVNEKYIEQELNELADLLLEEVKREEEKINLNTTVIDNLLKNAEHRNENSFTAGKMGKVRSEVTYIDNIKKLASLLIDKNTSDITQNVMDVSLETLPQDLLDDIEEAFLMFG